MSNAETNKRVPNSNSSFLGSNNEAEKPTNDTYYEYRFDEQETTALDTVYDYLFSKLIEVKTNNDPL